MQESLSLQDTLVELHRVESTKRERREDIVFSRLICDQIENTLTKELEDENFSEDDIQMMKRELQKLSIEDRKKLLSFPWEVRPRLFRRLKERIDAGTANIEGGLSGLLSFANEKGYTIGYHLSPRVIEQGEGEWNIDGYELDDRDEMLMAYYSLHYSDLYRKRRAQYLYLVRAEIGKYTVHKVDQSNNWGRANKLSIIDVVNIDELQQEVNKKLEK